MHHCPVTSDYFKITVTAGFYSELAGLLAGFAFTALMFLVATRIGAPDRRGDYVNAIRILVAAFLALVLTSLGYAVLAGEPGTNGRTASDEPILGVGFAVAGVLVIYAIVLTIDAASAASRPTRVAPLDVGASTRHVLAVALAPLLVLYIYLAVQDYESVRYGTCHSFEPLDALGWGLVAAQVALSWVGYPLMLRSGRRATEKYQELMAIWLSRILLIVAFVSAIVFGVADAELLPNQMLPPADPAVCVSLMFLAMAGMTWHLAYTSAPRRRNSAEAVTSELQSWVSDERETRLAQRVRRDFVDVKASDEVLRQLATLTDAALDDPGTERVQAAVVLIADGDPHRLARAMTLVRHDWREALIAAGLQHSDWPERLDDELGDRQKVPGHSIPPSRRGERAPAAQSATSAPTAS